MGHPRSAFYAISSKKRGRTEFERCTKSGALTLASLGLSLEMSPLATAKTPPHNCYAAA